MKDLLVFLAEGFEEIEALTVVDFLRRASLKVDMVSIYDRKEVTGAHGVTVLSDLTLEEANLDGYRGIYIPGGLPGAHNLRDKEEVISALKKYGEEGKITAAICAGPCTLDVAGLLTEGRFTCYPGYEENLKTKGVLREAVVQEGTVLTGMGPALAMEMAFALIEELKGKKAAEAIREEVLIPYLKEALV